MRFANFQLMIFTELFPIGVEYNYTMLKFRKNAHSSHFGRVFLMAQVKNEKKH